MSPVFVLGLICRCGGGMTDRFDRFTEGARKVLQLSQEEARRLSHDYIGTEHLLLALVREGDGVAAHVLQELGVELHKVRKAIEFIIGRGEHSVTGATGLTPRAKRVIELAASEADRLRHQVVDTEHILLGLIAEGEGIAAGILESLGVSLEKVRANVIEMVRHDGDYNIAISEATSQEEAGQPGPGLEQILTLLDYSMWARDRLLTEIEKLGESKLREVPSGGAYGSIHDTLAHMAGSEWLWLRRCMGDKDIKVPKGADFHDLAALVLWWDAAHAATMAWLDPRGFIDSALGHSVTYTGPDGMERTRKVWHMLLQIANHQTEHRGQLGTLLGLMGVEVPPMDLVVYLTEKGMGR